MATETKTYYPKLPMTIAAAEAITANTFIGFDGNKADLFDEVLGVADHAWDSGDMMNVYSGGIVPIELGETVVAGDPLIPDADGHGVKTAPAVQAKQVTADQALDTTTTLVDATALSLYALANTTYHLKLVFHIVNAKAGAQTIKVRLDVPTGATATASTFGANATADTLDAIVQGADCKAADIECVIDTSAVGVFVADIYLIMSTTAGTVSIQWAPKASDTDAMTLKKGSSMVATCLDTIPVAGYALDGGDDGDVVRIKLG